MKTDEIEGLAERESRDLAARTLALTERVTRQRQELSMLQYASTGLTLELERYVVRRVSLVWLVLTAMTLLATFAGEGRTSVRFVAFLLNWRGLYVRHNAQCTAAAALIMVAALLGFT